MVAAVNYKNLLEWGYSGLFYHECTALLIVVICQKEVRDSPVSVLSSISKVVQLKILTCPKLAG